MKNFRTSASHLITQGLLLACLLVLTMMGRDFDSVTKMPVLIIIDVIVFGFFLASIVRRVTIDGDILESRGLFRKFSVRISKIEYVQAMPALGRWVVILNDGKNTAVITSLVNDFSSILGMVRKDLNGENLERLEGVTDKKIKSRKIIYDCIMILLSVIVCYGIWRTSRGI